MYRALTRDRVNLPLGAMSSETTAFSPIMIYIHTYVRTYVRTYIHIYIHTYLHTFLQSTRSVCRDRVAVFLHLESTRFLKTRSTRFFSEHDRRVFSKHDRHGQRSSFRTIDHPTRAKYVRTTCSPDSGGASQNDLEQT